MKILKDADDSVSKFSTHDGEEPPFLPATMTWHGNLKQCALAVLYSAVDRAELMNFSWDPT